MNKFYTFVVAACTCIAAWASPSQPVKITEITEITLDPAMPAPPATFKAAPAKANDADYTEWKSLGTATFGLGYDYLLNTLNSFRIDGDEEIVFKNTTEVMIRQLRDDASVQQIKFCNFLGYNDMIGNYDPVTCLISIPQTPTGMPVPSRLATEQNCTSLDFMCRTVSYSEATKAFLFRNAWFMIDEIYGFRSDQFTAYLPDADPEKQFFTWATKSGGTKSTDTSITMDISYNGADHLRYITRHAEELPFTFDDINAIARGESEYKEATSELTINFDQGYGDYWTLALAMDANDHYIGVYTMECLTSNLAPAGTWQSIGRGIWRHPYLNTYQYNEFLDDNTVNTVYVEFPADKLQWEVEIEKRTDTDREIYRVVNPYSPSCALADTFNDTLDKIYRGDEAPYRPDAFRTDDTFWFVFDVTDPKNITFESGRPNGSGNSHFMSTIFHASSLYESEYRDKRLIIPHFDFSSLIIELPGYRGIGFQQTDDDYSNVIGNVAPDTKEIRYIIMPAQLQKPTEAEFTAEAARIADGSTSYAVHTVTPQAASDPGSGNVVVLPYKSLTDAPAWMLIVPIDNTGKAFDHFVAPLSYRYEEYTGVTVTEELLSPFTTEPLFFGAFNDLTAVRTVSPEDPNTDIYTLPNPYTQDPGWYSHLTVHSNPVGDWSFRHTHDTGDGNEYIYFGIIPTGLSIDEIYDSGDYYLYASVADGTRDGDKFTFPIIYVGLEGTEYAQTPLFDGACFTINIPGAGSNGIDNVKADTGNDANAPVEYFDLQGRRVTNPSAGIYIRRQGGHSSKLYVK